MNSMLTTFGIDLRLLIVQIINFLILLWILQKLVYRPIILRIEKDEQELERAKKETERLIREREQFTKEQKLTIHQTKKRAEEIISEAEMIAQALTKEAKTTMQQRLKHQEFRLDNLEKSHQLTWKKTWIRTAQQRMASSVQEVLSRLISPKNLTELQKTFFKHLLKELHSLMEKGEFNKLQSQEVILEHAQSLLPSHKRQIKKVFAPLGFVISYKQTPQLISGFRVTIASHVIQASLNQEINHAINSIS